MTYVWREEQLDRLDGPDRAWLPVEMSAGRRTVPPWIAGMHIDWCMDVGNWPRVMIKVRRGCNPELWDKKYDLIDDRRYISVSPDGQLMHQLVLEAPQLIDGKWQTRQGGGFAGGSFHIEMTDGRQVEVRGPWSGGPPIGWSELTWAPHSAPEKMYRSSKYRPWYKRGLRAGLYIRDDVLINAFATFAPHVLLAYVDYKFCVRLEPYQHEWGAPKEFFTRKARV